MSSLHFSKTISAAMALVLASTLVAACGSAPEGTESSAEQTPAQTKKAPEPAASGGIRELYVQCTSAQLQKCRDNDPEGWPGCYVLNGKAICIYN